MTLRRLIRRGGLVALVAALLASVAAISLAASGTDTLLGGQTLASGQTLNSLDGHYQLAMQTNGDLVLYLVSNGAQARVLWSTNTTGNPGATAVLQSDGNLIVQSTSGDTLWSSNTSSAGCTNLIVQEDGNLVLYNGTGAVWASHTLNTQMKSTGEELTEGQRIFSVDDQYELTMETNGNLAVYGPTGYLWSAGTRQGAGNDAVFTTTGDLRVYDSAGAEVWSAGVSGNAGGYLTMQTDGNLVDYSAAGKAVWSSKTNGTRAPGAGEFHKAAFQGCPAPTPAPTPTTTTPTTTTPAPTPAPSPVVAVPTPTTSPALRRLPVRLTLKWTYNRAHTQLQRITVRRMPRRVTLEIRCRGRGCAHKPLRADRRHLKRLIKAATGRSFHAGDRVLITISGPRFRTERVALRIRWGAKPRLHVL